MLRECQLLTEKSREMIWLLIIFCMAVAISPLMWIKASPRQRQIQQCREIARGLSLKVNIQRRPDARESERKLEAVGYWLAWGDSNIPQPWTLHRYSSRGWESQWEGWNWIVDEAPPEWQAQIQNALNLLPADAQAIVVNGSGVGVIWQENGDESTVHKIKDCLTNLKEKGGIFAIEG